MALFKEKEKREYRIFIQWLGKSSEYCDTGCEACTYYSHLLPWETTVGEWNSHKKGIAEGITKKWNCILDQIRSKAHPTSELFQLCKPINPLYYKPIWDGFSVTTSEETLTRFPINFQPTLVMVLPLHSPQHVLSHVISNFIIAKSNRILWDFLFNLSQLYFFSSISMFSSLCLRFHTCLACFYPLWLLSVCLHWWLSCLGSPSLSPPYFPSKWLAVSHFFYIYNHLCVSSQRSSKFYTWIFKGLMHTAILDIP